jgi:putative peptidoglycan lipid II flippase
MVALMALRIPIISVLFERGAFTVNSTVQTAWALLCYALGLWAFSVIRVIVSAFYSLQDTKSPMKAAIVALVVNVAFSVVLMFPLKHGGIALATSIASAVNVGMLSVILWRRIGSFLMPDFFPSLAKVTLSSALMWGVILGVDLLYPWDLYGPFSRRALFLALTVVLGGAAFLLSSWILKSPEMTALADALRRRIGRSRGAKTP